LAGPSLSAHLYGVSRLEAAQMAQSGTSEITPYRTFPGHGPTTLGLPSESSVLCRTSMPSAGRAGCRRSWFTDRRAALSLAIRGAHPARRHRLRCNRCHEQDCRKFGCLCLRRSAGNPGCDRPVRRPVDYNGRYIDRCTALNRNRPVDVQRLAQKPTQTIPTMPEARA
jgi:hypothetical protein